MGVTVRIRTLLAGVLAFALVAGLGIYLGWQHWSGLLTPACTVDIDAVTAPDGMDGRLNPVTLSPEQMANAATIAAVGIRREMPERAVVVALATALQESRLRNLPDGDRDSIGLFQQRPSMGWGTPQEISDPRYAAGKFYDSLRKVRGWQQMRITEAAQHVQRSAHPEAYQKWAKDATVLASALLGRTAGAVRCELREDPKVRGTAAATGLAENLSADWGKLTAVTSVSRVPTLSLTVSNGRTGWQYAHWLVAHAAGSGITRVRYADLQWTGKHGSWKKIGSGDAADDERVVADLSADRHR